MTGHDDALHDERDTWTQRDYHVDRPDVPGHAFYTELHSYGFAVSCTCGWTATAEGISVLTEVKNRHRMEAAR